MPQRIRRLTAIVPWLVVAVVGCQAPWSPGPAEVPPPPETGGAEAPGPQGAPEPSAEAEPAPEAGGGTAGGSGEGSPPAAERPPAPPGTLPAAPRWRPLAEAVARARSGFSGRLSVVAVDLETGDRWEYRATDAYHPASTIKVPVALFALAEARAGRLRWDDPVQLAEADFEPPLGALADVSPGTAVPVGRLVDLALRESNNTAVNALGRHLGWGRIREFARSIGGGFDRGPLATPRAAAAWWLYLWKLRQTAPEEAELLVAPLRKATYRGRIAAAVPPGVEVWHKYGSYLGYEHDTGIVLGPRPFLLVVYTGDGKPGEADKVIVAITRGAWQTFAGPAAGSGG
ncbi:MAG: class A beta-lactamase-related serine hydrolase [Firmicutes bacterium]|nr:class A beta-lactamase-related serine hydrolase [Bacillota bacterium]